MPLSGGGTDGGPRRSHRVPWSWPDPPHRPQRGGRPALAAVARPAGEVAGLLLVEVLCSPRARAASLDLARSLARWLAGRRPPALARAEVTTRRVMVVKDTGTSVLVHRVETALVVLTREWPALGPQTISNARAARDNSGK
jgi:hypothetical protein